MDLRSTCSTAACVLWLVLCARRASATVVIPAPANVSVVCKNFQVVVSWKYSEPLLDTRFKVSRVSRVSRLDEGKVLWWNMTGDLWYDISGVVWASLWNSRDVFAINVSAVRGGQESTVSLSPSFTFNHLSNNRAQMHCTLELPPVGLDLYLQKASLHFQNPMNTHRELSWAQEHQNTDPLVLGFDVTEDGGFNTLGRCGALEPTCTLEFTLLHERGNHCVSLKAGLENDVVKVVFRPVDAVCGKQGADTEPYGILLGLLLAGFLLVVSVVVFMVWKTKACVRRVPAFPFLFPDRSRLSQPENVMELQSEVVSLVRTTQRGPPTASTEDGARAEDEEVVVVLGEEELGEEEPVRDYEPRPAWVDMGVGDVVQTYGL